MKKYFSERAAFLRSSLIGESQLSEYRSLVVAEMKKKGATNEELTLLRDETIVNSIQKKRQPEDVAWAILQ